MKILLVFRLVMIQDRYKQGRFSEANSAGYFSDVYSSLSSYRYTPRVGSPLSIDDPVQRVRQQNYISRWNDMFSQDRLDAMDTLRRYSDDYENNQRIIFLAIQVCYVLLLRNSLSEM